MAHVHGKAGASPHDTADRFMHRALVLIILVGTMTYLLVKHVADIGNLGVGGVALLGVAAVSFSVLAKGIGTLEGTARRYYGGARGESRVGRLLARLPEEYHVFNGVRFYAGDIDHVVVGPTGIFVVETKVYAGTISLRAGQLTRNGQPLERDLVRQATAETTCVKDLLGVAGTHHVHPILVFVKARVRLHETLDGVRVVPVSLLVSSIVRRRSSLHPLQIQEYARVLAQATGTRQRVADRRVTPHPGESLSGGSPD
jgi:hypothetical protein